MILIGSLNFFKDNFSPNLPHPTEVSALARYGLQERDGALSTLPGAGGCRPLSVGHKG